MRRDTALLVCLIFLFSLPAANAFHGSPAEGTVTEGLYQDEDGHWWVVEDKYREVGGYVYEFDSSWNKVGYGEPLGDLDSSQTQYPDEDEKVTADEITPQDIYRGNDGYWWVLSNNYHTYRYDAEWNYTGVRKSLSRLDYHGMEDLSQDRQGNWWVLQEGSNLITYDENWNYRKKINIRSTTLGLEILQAVEPGSNNLTLIARSTLIDGETLYILRNSAIEEYRLDDSGGISNGPVETHNLEAIERASDFHRSETGWWVLDRSGGVYKYTDDLSYTGEKKQIGSDSVIHEFPSDMSLAGLVVFFTIASGMTPLIGIYLFIVFIIIVFLDNNPDDSETHDPSEYETTVSQNWFYVIAVGAVLWIIAMLFIYLVPTESRAARDAAAISLVYFAMFSGVVFPIAIYYDMKYVRSNSKWNPNTAFWMIGTVTWFVNFFVVLVYLLMRHGSLENLDFGSGEK